MFSFRGEFVFFLNLNILTMYFIISETNKGKKIVLHDGYIYRIEYRIEGRIYFMEVLQQKM
jgi:hypothetical protein